MLTDKNGATLLHYAVEGGHLPVVNYLINDCKIDAAITDKDGVTPFHYSLQVLGRQLSVVMQHLCNQCTNTENNEAISLAIDQQTLLGHQLVSQYFVNDCNCSAIITNEPSSSRTPLHAAALIGHFPIVKYFY